jgi:putative SOS response-associated peptidase YedK
MPIIIPDADWEGWLDPDNNDKEAVRALMGTYPSNLMAEYPVSTLVNKVANNTPDLLTRLDTPAIDLG